MKRTHPLVIWAGIIILVLTIGVLGFMLVEHWSFLDALYMTIITITTVGYQEIKPLTDNGKIFNIIFIIASFSTFTYALASLTRYIISGEMQLYFKNKKIMSSLDNLRNHVIICGFGRNGQQAAITLMDQQIPFVVIEPEERNIREFTSAYPNLIFIIGDATEDALLKKAGIERAVSLITTLPDDADNVFIVLSARSLNTHLQIISRASFNSAVPKLKKAGANHVIMPDKIGGKHMATIVSKPDVVAFIDYLTGHEDESMNIESVGYEQLPAAIRNSTLQQIMDWQKTGVNCIGIKQKNGRFLINPPENTAISDGMKLIILGSKQQIHKMKSNLG
ncbi:MAG: potassium channel protein [Sphingobacteriales bacterium]|uniref:potassium channel family protein n=1 Tax=Hydrotalea flava TaxID=714549 RepID=UPI00082A6781|nr:potassium channel protein [Hydrotalea flava]RTL47512.1 MAG: potassium channel protein [Sphingobacteriales bacterium]